MPKVKGGSENGMKRTRMPTETARCTAMDRCPALPWKLWRFSNFTPPGIPRRLQMRARPEAASRSFLEAMISMAAFLRPMSMALRA